VSLPVATALALSRVQASENAPTLADPVASSATPLAYFLHGSGPAAIPVLHLDWILTAICSLVCVVIATMLGIAIFRRRKREDSRAISAGGGLRLVYIGTVISTMMLAGIGIYMLWVLAAVADPPREPALAITVTAYDWWWKVDYGDSNDHFATANEIHIPVGEPVLVKLRSADVIHAFWVTELSGKTQTIPGVVNRQWIQSDHPGIFRGQCTQYCGVQHAHMAFEVYAEPRATFDRWYAAQQQAAIAPQTAQAIRGSRIFNERCAGCNAVRGSTAAGVQAPDLTHVRSRRLLAAGTIVNTPENVMQWIEHAQDVKPGTLMPSMKLTPAEAGDLSAYIATLK
jgi:cytochrome c oxidase subunit 2